jgi:hypothetical protein
MSSDGRTSETFRLPGISYFGVFVAEDAGRGYATIAANERIRIALNHFVPNPFVNISFSFL